jgi:hypothetical protein
MHVSVDGVDVEMPRAATLGELLEAIAPRIDPVRLVTQVEVDGRPADSTDRRTLARWRLGGGESVRVATEAPTEFVAARRRQIPEHLTRIADLLTVVAESLAGGESFDAQRILAAAARELGLVLELEQCLTILAAGPSPCEAVAETVRRIGPQLADAERDRRWRDVAALLADELVPALRASAA